MRITRYLPPLITVLALVLAWPTARAGKIDAHILQFQLERLYIDVGSDRFVLPGCKFWITCHGDREYVGRIEYSLPGVAITEKIDTTLGPEFLNTCHVIVDSYDIDRAQPVTLGITTRFPLALIDRPDSSGFHEELSPRFERYGSNLNMLFDFQTGDIDGFLTYHHPELIEASGHTAGYSAPFVAALVPNLTHETNHQAHLTTALYYLFDHAKLPLLFDGDSMRIVYSFFEEDTVSTRPFNLDLDRGRQLLARVVARSEVTIAVGYPSLRGIADYYADILARNQIKVYLVEDEAAADCILTYIPLSPPRTLTALGWILDRLPSDTIAGSPVAEGVAMAAEYYESGVAADDSTSRMEYFRKAQQRLINEVGIFPMFRPMLFVTTSAATARLEPGHGMDLTHLVRLIPPDYIREQQR